MTQPEFQIRHGEWLKKILDSSEGKALIETLRDLEPAATPQKEEHMNHVMLGIKIGYPRAVMTLISLSQSKPTVPDPKQNYGVAEKAPEI